MTERIDETDGKHYFDFNFILPVNFDRVTEEFKKAKDTADEAKRIAEVIDSKAQQALDKVNELDSDPNKLDKNLGVINAHKILVVGEDGNIIPSEVKLYKETDSNGKLSYVLDIPEEET